MSKAKNMVKWCINKAKAEIEKGEIHRGLIETKPDEGLALNYLKKAEHNLDVFLYNKGGGFYDWTINIGFYYSIADKIYVGIAPFRVYAYACARISIFYVKISAY